MRYNHDQLSGGLPLPPCPAKPGGRRPRRVLPSVVAAVVATAVLLGAFLNSGCGSDKAASTNTTPTQTTSSDDRNPAPQGSDAVVRGDDSTRGGGTPPKEPKQKPSTTAPDVGPKEPLVGPSQGGQTQP
jgi:hypothetical protein